MTIQESDGLKYVSHCTRCMTLFSKEDMQCVEKKDEKTILHVSCSVCRQNMIISFIKKEGSVLCAGTVTDLSYKNACDVLSAEKVSVDDVLLIHEALELDNFMKIG